MYLCICEQKATASLNRITSTVFRRVRKIAKGDYFLSLCHFMFNNVFPKIMPFKWQCGKILYQWPVPGHWWQHGACTLHARYLRLHIHLCNTHCCSTATMTARRGLIVTLHVHCLSCYNRNEVCLLRGTSCAFITFPVPTKVPMVHSMPQSADCAFWTPRGVTARATT